MIGIIGASGFIGRSIADHFGAQGRPYHAFVRSPQLLPENVFSGEHQLNQFEIGGDMDMSLFKGLSTLVLATSATKPNIQHNGVVNEVQKNVLPHCQMFTELVKTDVKHIVLLSSGGTIYGNCDQDTPITEDAPRQPCTPYGYGKLCIESALENIWVGAGRRYTIIRPSNPVGGHQMASVGAHGLVTTTFHNIQTDKTVNVFGDGTTVRDYFSVHDLSTLIQAVADNTDVRSTVINASSGQGYSINDIVETCAKVLDKTPQIEYLYDKQPEIQYNVLSNQKAFDLFGWKPQYTLMATIEDLRSHLGSGVA